MVGPMWMTTSKSKERGREALALFDPQRPREWGRLSDRVGSGMLLGLNHWHPESGLLRDARRPPLTLTARQRPTPRTSPSVRGRVKSRGPLFMHPKVPSVREGKRVLAIFPHHRALGRVVLDGGVPVPRTFGSVLMGRAGIERGAEIALTVARDVVRHRPTVVAIAIVEQRRSALVDHAERVLRYLGIRCVIVETERLLATLADGSLPRGYDKIAQVVAGHVPQLAPLVLPTARRANLRRRRAFAWRAALAALAVSTRGRGTSNRAVPDSL